MRSDYFILWKDENITNSENSEYMKDLSKKIEVNVYFKSSVDEALNLIRLKKYNKIKLITNGGHELTGKKLIQEARKIIGSNFLCFVFASNDRHLNWVLDMENVIFTTIPKVFKEFAELKMNMNDVLNFIRRLEESSHVNFRINQEELLKFPLTKKKDRFFKNDSNANNKSNNLNNDSENQNNQSDININLINQINDVNDSINLINHINDDDNHKDNSENQIDMTNKDTNKQENDSNKPNNKSSKQVNDLNKPNNESTEQVNDLNKPNNELTEQVIDSNKSNDKSKKQQNISNKTNIGSNKETNKSNNSILSDKPRTQKPNASFNNSINEKEIKGKDKRCEIF